MREKWFSKIAFFFCAGFLVVLFSAAFFIPLQTGHACTHDEHCPVCLQVRGAVNLLKQIESVYPRLGGVIVFSGAPVQYSKFSFPGFAASTAITLKVRMNT